MIRALFLFIVIYTIFHVGIHTLRSLSKSKLWSLTKTFMYSMMCTLLTMAVIIAIVVLF